MAKFKKKAKKPDIDVTALTKEASAVGNSKKAGKKKNKLKEEKRKTKKLKGAAKDQIKVKKVKKSNLEDVEEEEDVLTLDILKELGGDEEDLKLVQAIDGNDVAADDLNAETENELKSLLKSLNFKKFKPKDFVVNDDEVAAEEEEEEKAEEVVDAKKSKEKGKSKVQDSQISSTTAADPKEEVKEEDDDDAPLLPDSVTQRADFHFVKEPPARTHHVLKATDGAKWFELVSNSAATPEVRGRAPSNS
jgi:ribosome biogenesis protein MAK21